MAPTPDECTALLRLPPAPPPLLEAEAYLLALARAMPRLRAKACALRFSAALPTMADELVGVLTEVAAAARQVQAAPMASVLRCMLDCGNTLNEGTRWGNARSLRLVESVPQVLQARVPKRGQAAGAPISHLLDLVALRTVPHLPLRRAVPALRGAVRSLSAGVVLDRLQEFDHGMLTMEAEHAACCGDDAGGDGRVPVHVHLEVAVNHHVEVVVAVNTPERRFAAWLKDAWKLAQSTRQQLHACVQVCVCAWFAKCVLHRSPVCCHRRLIRCWRRLQHGVGMPRRILGPCWGPWTRW